MKTIWMSKLARKVLILSFLIVCLVSIMSSDNGQRVAAARCCSQCAPNGSVPYGDFEALDVYCTNKCGASSGTCYNSCENSIYACWGTCDTGC